MYEERICATHGLTRFKQRKDHNGFRCVKCNTAHVANHRKKKKKILIDEMGGGCFNCGYNRCIRALEFHHIDPTQKSFGFGQINLASSLTKLRKEAKKCVLLCANCHREAEDGLIKF
jgi:hypothetical protein